MDMGILATLDFPTYKANLDLVAQTVSGSDSTQFNLNLERQQHTIPLLNPLVSTLIEVQKKIQDWSALPAEKRYNRTKLTQAIRDIETLARIQGAIAALMAVGDIILNESMREQLALAEAKSASKKRTKKESKKTRKR